MMIFTLCSAADNKQLHLRKIPGQALEMHEHTQDHISRNPYDDYERIEREMIRLDVECMTAGFYAAMLPVAVGCLCSNALLLIPSYQPTTIVELTRLWAGGGCACMPVSGCCGGVVVPCYYKFRDEERFAALRAESDVAEQRIKESRKKKS